MSDTTKRLKITFEKNDCEGGTTTWYVLIDGKCVAYLSRDTPTRWHANGVGGLVLDREAPKAWGCTLYDYDGVFAPNWGTALNYVKVCTIPDGSSAPEAKKIVREILPNWISALLPNNAHCA